MNRLLRLRLCDSPFCYTPQLHAPTAQPSLHTITTTTSLSHARSLVLSFQAVDEIIAGNLPVESEDEVAKVVAQAMVVEFGDEMPDNEDVSSSCLYGWMQRCEFKMPDT